MAKAPWFALGTALHLLEAVGRQALGRPHSISRVGEAVGLTQGCAGSWLRGAMGRATPAGEEDGLTPAGGVRGGPLAGGDRTHQIGFLLGTGEEQAGTRAPGRALRLG